jgi:hypothetical protein
MSGVAEQRPTTSDDTTPGNPHAAALLDADYGHLLNGEQLAGLYQRIETTAELQRRMRLFALHNGDAPAPAVLPAPSSGNVLT